MSATVIKNTPIETLRERGGLKATIWFNATPNSTKGGFYSVELSRVYRTDEGYKNSRSFNDSDLLFIARLAEKAHDRIRELRAAATAASSPADSEVPQPTVQ